MEYAADLRGLARLLVDREISVAEFEAAYASLNSEVHVEAETRYARGPVPRTATSTFWRGALMFLGAVVIVIIGFVGVGSYLMIVGMDSFGKALDKQFSPASYTHYQQQTDEDGKPFFYPVNQGMTEEACVAEVRELGGRCDNEGGAL